MSCNKKMIRYDVDLANYFAITMQVKLEVMQTLFGKIADVVKNGKANLAISGMTITSKRSQDLTFVDPYNISDMSILTTRTNAEKVKMLILITLMYVLLH